MFPGLAPLAVVLGNGSRVSCLDTVVPRLDPEAGIHAGEGTLHPGSRREFHTEG